MKGLALGLPYAGVRADRQRGGDLRAGAPRRQSHAYTWDEFTQRFESHFGPLPIGDTEAEQLEN